MATKIVYFFLDGNAVRITPITRDLMRLLIENLSYTRRKHLITWEDQQSHGGKKILLREIQCYAVYDFAGSKQVVTNAGYVDKLRGVLTEDGYTIHVEDLRPEDPDVYKPKWAAIEGIDFRYKQRETIVRMATLRRGRIWWATGAGKGWILPHFCRVMCKCRIVVTTKHISVLETNFNRLRSFLPSVGIYHSRARQLGRRVMCYGAGSLLHAVKEFKPHIVVADEVQELASDRMFGMFNKFRHARMFSLSANDGDRFDNADFELEGIFGPIISSLSYPEAERHGMVVPIHVQWVAVDCDDPVGRSSGTPAWRWGIWRNEVRNQLIADAARQYPDNQILITCQTLEHACFIKQKLPEFTLCYSPSESHGRKLDMYKSWKLLSSDERLMTIDKLKWMRARFETGKLRKVIATTVWNRGVSFDHLQVLIRADGSSDMINDTQIPGRLARVVEGKEYGLLIDFLDNFNTGRRRRSDCRRRDYAKKNWVQHFPATPVAAAGRPLLVGGFRG